MKCFVDMDGVLTDFVSGACNIHNRENPYEDRRNHGEFDMAKLWGISTSEFWEPMNYNFWRSLSPLPLAKEIIDFVLFQFGEKNVAILTSPSWNEGCMDAKRDWIQEFFPTLKRRVIFCTVKDMIAHSHALLIDDHDRNVSDFIASGGKAVLVPQLWNSKHFIFEHSMIHVESEVLSQCGY